MTLLSLTDCCHLLSVDAKTLRRWLAQAQLTPQPHPADARSSGLTADEVRLLASAHHRSLPTLPGALPVLVPAGPAPALSSLPRELRDLLQTLSTLPEQVAALQQQLAGLTARLAVPPRLSSPSQEGQAPRPARPRASTPAHARPARLVASPPSRPPTHVLPRVESGQDGRYMVLCPKAGLLAFEPDSSAWFAWLATQSSFRFVGKAGHFTAHHEWRVPRGAWRAHRHIRNHGYSLRLAPTHELTIAVLERAAQALQAHLL